MYRRHWLSPLNNGTVIVFVSYSLQYPPKIDQVLFQVRILDDFWEGSIWSNHRTYSTYADRQVWADGADSNKTEPSSPLNPPLFDAQCKNTIEPGTAFPTPFHVSKAKAQTRLRIQLGWLVSGEFRRVRGAQSNPRWSPNYFTFMRNSEKMLVKFSNRSPSAKLNPHFKIPESALVGLSCTPENAFALWLQSALPRVWLDCASAGWSSLGAHRV